MNYKIQNIINKLSFGLTEMGPGFDLKDIWYNLKYGIKNLRMFFWVVWKWRGFDYTFNLDLMGRGLELYLTYPNYEIDETRIPKEEDIKRVIKLINRFNKADFLTQVEEKIGYELTKRDIEFKVADIEGLENEKEDFYELVDRRTKQEIEKDDKIYELSETLEKDQWEELFDNMKKNARGWWN